MAGQIAVHALPHDEGSLAVSNESLADLRGMLDNDDAVDDLQGRRSSNSRRSTRTTPGTERKPKEGSTRYESLWKYRAKNGDARQEAESSGAGWRKPASVEVDAAAQKGESPGEWSARRFPG